MESRLTDLEVRYAYLERTVGELNTVTIELRAEVDELRRELAAFRKLAEEPAEPTPPAEKPPHY